MQDGVTAESRFNGQAAHAITPMGAPDAASVRERCVTLGIQWLDDAPDPEPQAVAAITADVAGRLRVVPVCFENHRLIGAMRDPLDIAAADEIAALTGKPITRIGLDP